MAEQKKHNQGRASREKGKRGERELASILREAGYHRAMRGVQYCGKEGNADVVGIPGIHIECKRVNKLNLSKAMAQSAADAKDGEIPVVMHRRDREDWLCTCRLSDFLALVRESKTSDSNDKM